jgi:hypothetical protein
MAKRCDSLSICDAQLEDEMQSAKLDELFLSASAWIRAIAPWLFILVPSLALAHVHDEPTSSTKSTGHMMAPANAIPAATALLEGYGTGGFTIKTSSQDAQAYFNNGMQLAHAFAHKASIAAFRRAEQLDPGCAMCVWGEAWAYDQLSDQRIGASAAGRFGRSCGGTGQRQSTEGADIDRRLAEALSPGWR